MAQPKDDVREGQLVEEESAEERLKAALSDELVQIFLATRDAIVPGGVALEKQKLDLDAANAALSVMSRLSPETSMEEIRWNILAVPLTKTIREQIAQSCPELALGFDDVRHHHVMRSIQGSETVDDKGFLKEMIASKIDKLSSGLTEEVCHDLNCLEAEIKLYYAPNDVIGIAHLLYWVLDGDIERVETIITAQIRSYKNMEQESSPPSSGREVTVPTPPVFFRQLATFLKEYGYISKFLLDNSEHPNGMEERCRTGLAEVLRHPSLTMVRRSPEDPVVDLDQIHYELTTPSEVTRSGEFVNPWFQGDLKQTPFDALKVSNILRMNMSYQEKASVLLAINRYAMEGDETTTTLVDAQKQLKSNRKSPQEAFSPEALVLGKAFLALLHPKCIVKNRSVQPEFMDIVKSLEGDERLKGDPELAQSISTLLHTKDPYLDIPIWQCRNKSIRELLMNLCFEYFDDATIRDGLPTNEGDTIRLFPLSDAEGLVLSPEVPLQRHFSSAFIGLERGFLTDVAKGMASIYSFDEIIRMAEKEAQRYFRDKHRYNYHFYLSASSAFRDVIRQCFFTEYEYQHGDFNVIATNQEFNGITEVFKKNEDHNRGKRKDFQDPGLRIVSLNNEQTHEPKTLDELFDDISVQIDLKKTKIILISSLTRFGDAPCTGGKKSCNGYLAQLIHKLKVTYPDIFVAIDACQAIGRTPTVSLAELGADIYFMSGGKALGVGNVNTGGSISVVALSQQFLGKLSSAGHKPHFSHSYPSTFPKGSTAAMSLAMHMLRSNIDLFRAEGNLGDNRKYTLEQKIVRHMNDLTEYAIDQADQYGEIFVAENLSAIAPELVQNYPHDDLVSWMGCRVHYPAHRSRNDYGGIITVDFPSKSGRYLLPALQAKPYKFDMTPCLYKDRALRISFHYLHEKADIDALFSALRSVHADLLEKDLKQGKRLRDARYWTPS